MIGVLRRPVEFARYTSIDFGRTLRTPVRFVFADGGFAGRLIDWAQTILRTTPHIVRKPADQRGFAVIPRRWAVERTFAWLTAHRRLAGTTNATPPCPRP
jgi:transposase